MYAQAQVELANVLATKGNVEGALEQMERARQFVYDHWLKRAGGDVPGARTDRERADEAFKASLKISGFWGLAWPVWKQVGRPELAGRVCLDLAASQRGLVASGDEFTRRRAADLAFSQLLFGGDWVLEGGQREEARSAFEEALGLIDSLSTDKPERVAASRFNAGIRAAWLRSDREEVRRLLETYSRRRWMTQCCSSFAYSLSGAERLEFLREVLPRLPAELVTSAPADEDPEGTNCEPLLYEHAIRTAFELGLDDEVAKYTREFEERYPTRARSRGLLGPLENRVQGPALIEGTDNALRGAPSGHTGNAAPAIAGRSSDSLRMLGPSRATAVPTVPAPRPTASGSPASGLSEGNTTDWHLDGISSEVPSQADQRLFAQSQPGPTATREHAAIPRPSEEDAHANAGKAAGGSASSHNRDRVAVWAAAAVAGVGIAIAGYVVIRGRRKSSA